MLSISVLEVYQFAHDASVCEVWLSQQQGMVHGDPSGEVERSIDETEQMIRKLDGFEKAAAPWETRFGALEKVTAVGFYRWFDACGPKPNWTGSGHAFRTFRPNSIPVPPVLVSFFSTLLFSTFSFLCSSN